MNRLVNQRPMHSQVREVGRALKHYTNPDSGVVVMIANEDLST